MDNSRSDNTETPLIIPDISPTNKDLEDSMTDGDLGTIVVDATNDVNNDDDNDDSENNIDANSDTDRENDKDSSDANSDTDRENDKDSNDGEDVSSDDEPSLIPFP
jgi:hypothetical protein